MPKLSTTDLGTLRSDSALTTYNANLAAIEAALENTLSRDGTSPNTMSASLDMNSQRIINLPAPVSDHEAARHGDLQDYVDAADTSADAAAASATAAATSATNAATSATNASTSATAAATSATAAATSATAAAASAASVVSATLANGYLKVTDAAYGAVGDGVTSDQTAIAAAVAAAHTGGYALYWPPGNYLSTANIANFRNVFHFGPGRITRGSDTFYIEPGDANTNILYVATTGSSSNDGITSSQPMASLANVITSLINTTPNQRGGTWRIKFAAGTYTDSSNFTDLPFFRNAIEFIGTGSSRTPQTIFDATGAAYQTAGMYFQNRTNVYLQYIKFQDFTTGYGLLAEHNCQVELVDCDAENCLIGFGAGYSSFIRTTRCTADTCEKGFQVSTNSQASFTPTTDSIADSNRAYDCDIGFMVTRMSYAHIDYNEIEDCDAGIVIEINSRSAALANNFKRNGVAIRCWTSGFVSLGSGATLNTYNEGTADANTEVYEYRGGSGSVNDYQAGTTDLSVYKSTTTITHTGTLTETQVGTTFYTVPAGWFIDGTKRIRFKAWGTTTTTGTGTIQLKVKLGSTIFTTVTLPINLTAAAWEFYAEIAPTASNAQKTFSKFIYDGGVDTEVQTDTLDMNTARAITLHADINGDTAATISIESIEVIICG